MTKEVIVSLLTFLFIGIILLLLGLDKNNALFRVVGILTIMVSIVSLVMHILMPKE